MRDEAFYTEAELVDGKARTGYADVEWVEEPSYFLDYQNGKIGLLTFTKKSRFYLAKVAPQ